MKDAIDIIKNKIILVEGRDAERFIFKYLIKKDIIDIQVIDYGGIKQLTKMIQYLQSRDNFNDVVSILVFRDSEECTKSAIDSINYSLKTTGLIQTEINPFLIEEINNRKIGFGLFPGFDEEGNLGESGRLEDLCLKLLDTTNNELIKKYLKDFQEKTSIVFSKPHKNEFHASVSFTDKYVGALVGQIMERGGFDLNSQFLQPFVNMIEKM